MDGHPQDTAPVSSTLSERWTRGGRLALIWAGLVLVTTTIVVLGARSGSRGLTGVESRDPWCRYDCGWYVGIAENGYWWDPHAQSPVAFFPLFPLVVRALSAIGDPLWMAQALALAAGLASVLAFGGWVRARLSPPAATAAIAALLVYPYSVYLFGGLYSDALFLALAIGAFRALEGRHWWWAGALGAAATATRPLGLALVFGLIVRTLELTAAPTAGARHRLGELVRAVWGPPWRRYAVLLSALGLIGYGGFLWVAFGDPLAFVHTQSSPGWDQGSGPRVWAKVGFWGSLVKGLPVAWLLLPQAVGCLGAVLVLPLLRRRLGWGYAAYTAALVALPLVGTKDFMGAGRYLLNAFPVFAAVGVLLGEHPSPAVRRAVLSISAVALLGAAYLFGRGVQIA